MNSAVRIIHLQIFLFLFGMSLGTELLGPVVIVCSIFRRVTGVCANVAVLAYIYTELWAVLVSL